MCGLVFFINSDNPACTENVETNVSAVIGIVSSGIAYSQFEEISSSMNVPIFSERYFAKTQDKVFDEWETTAVEEMNAAAERERQAAIAEGRVKDGIPIIDVYADGCWSARSYGNNYRALSGAAVIIGRKFGEVLFMAVKNKYCVICARAHNKNTVPKDHICYKNYEGSSSGMEAEIICDGFRHSIEMYNIIYGRLIADGDSATYAKILAQNPYPNTTVVKIECRNHILRNLCNKLRAVSKEVKYPLKFRKLLSDKKVMTVRKVVLCSIKEQRRLIQEGNITKMQAIQILHADVQNSLLHAFGDHRRCKNYYCQTEKSLMSAMEVQNSTFWFRLKVIIGTVASKSQSLVEDADTNTAERFNSIIAKIVGGKRVNFSMRRAYQGRCAAAVVAFNNKLPRYTIHKKILGKSPKSVLKKMELRRYNKRLWNRNNPHKKNRLHKINQTKNDYGANCAAPDMIPDVLERAKKDFLENLATLTSDKERIEKETKLQRDCSDWLELRKNMVTASNFGKIIKKRQNTSSANLVKNLLYSENISHVASIAHGVENEKLALQQLEQQEKIIIEPCGLFVDRKYAFIGATPDGIIGEDTIVEVKCPVMAFKKGIEQAIKENKIQIYKYDKKKDTYKLNRNSNWFYQVQGQLHVSNRQKCLFAIWGGQGQDLKTEYIEREDDMWTEKMEKKIVDFYMQSILPEILDSRHTRGMPIRNCFSIPPAAPPPLLSPMRSTRSPPLNNSPLNNSPHTPTQLKNIQPRVLDYSEF